MKRPVIPPRSGSPAGAVSRRAGGPPEIMPTAGPSEDRLWSRRQWLRLGASAAGAAVGPQALMPGLARADGHGPVDPIPIPSVTNLGGTDFHIEGPGPADQGAEPSAIFDFKGFIGIAAGGGTGQDGHGTPLTLSFDYRFTKGEYIGVDHRRHSGAFAFL